MTVAVKVKAEYPYVGQTDYEPSNYIADKIESIGLGSKKYRFSLVA